MSGGLAAGGFVLGIASKATTVGSFRQCFRPVMNDRARASMRLRRLCAPIFVDIYSGACLVRPARFATAAANSGPVMGFAKCTW